MPAGLPDWTVPTAIVAQLIDKLAVDIVAQTIGNVKVDIAAQSLSELNVNVTNAQFDVNIVGSDITLPVSIKSSSVTLDVNIVGSDITLPVSIKSSSVTLDVNIAAQNITLDIDVSAQSVGLKPEDVWSAEQGYNKSIVASATVGSGSGLTMISYTVPSGKKLYVKKVHASPFHADTSFYVYVRDDTAGVTYALAADDKGREFDFSPPLVIPGGNTVKVVIYNTSSADDDFAASLLGWEK